MKLKKSKLLCNFNQKNNNEADFWNTLNIEGITKNIDDHPVNPNVIKIIENAALTEILSDVPDNELIVRPAVFAYNNTLCSAIFFKDNYKKDLDLPDYFMFPDPKEVNDFQPILAVFDKKFYFQEPSIEEVSVFFSAALLNLAPTKYLDHQFLVLAVLDKTFEELDKKEYEADKEFREHFEKYIKYNKLSAVFDNHPNFKISDGIRGKTEDILEKKKNKLILYETQVSEFQPEYSE